MNENYIVGNMTALEDILELKSHPVYNVKLTTVVMYCVVKDKMSKIVLKNKLIIIITIKRNKRRGSYRTDG